MCARRPPRVERPEARVQRVRVCPEARKRSRYVERRGGGGPRRTLSTGRRRRGARDGKQALRRVGRPGARRVHQHSPESARSRRMIDRLGAGRRVSELPLLWIGTTADARRPTRTGRGQEDFDGTPALPPSAPLPPAQQPADALAAGADRTCEPAEPAAAALADDPVRPEPVLAVDDGRQAEGARRERRQGRAGRDAEEDDHCRAPGRKGGVSGRGRGIGGTARWASDGGGRTLELGRLVDGRASEDGTCDQGSRTVTRESISGRVRVGGAVLKATWSAPVMRPGMLTRPTIDIWLIVGSCSSGQVRGEDGRGRRQTSSAPREASPRFVTYERHLDRLARDRPRCLEARRALCPGSHDGSSAVVSRERPHSGA